jgi:hypothetical protein
MTRMREEEDGLDCLDLLEETPSILRGLRRELNHEDAAWKPAPDRFSVAEVLIGLRHHVGKRERHTDEDSATVERDAQQHTLASGSAEGLQVVAPFFAGNPRLTRYRPRTYSSAVISPTSQQFQVGDRPL